MMKHTTIYCNNSDTTAIRATTGAVAGLSMWNTIMNVLRTRQENILAYEDTDGEIYETADGQIYALKR